MATDYQTSISSDVIWQATRKNNSFLCKRAQAGGVQFSRDPFNLVNKHSRKYEGYANDQAIAIKADDNTVQLMTKLPSRTNKPAASFQTSSFSASTPSRKLYRSIVNSTAKKGYRSDLRAEAVARASAVKYSQKEKKERKTTTKLRGAKARKAKETSS